MTKLDLNGVRPPRSEARGLKFFHEYANRFGIFEIPCPRCGSDCKSDVKKRRKVLKIWHEEPGFITFNCVRCGWRGYDGGGERLDSQFDRVQTVVAHDQTQQQYEARRIEAAKRIWWEATPAIGTLVDTYLASRRLQLPEAVLAADTIRFHPACPFGKARLPAMVALMRDVVTDMPRAIHRTALRPDGSGKADMPDGANPKQMLGPAKGAAIKLVRRVAGEGLGIAEGIETALSVICAGVKPVWACGSAGAIKSFPTFDVENILIFADRGNIGEESARTCAANWSKNGVSASVVLPPPNMSDWAEAWEGFSC